MSMPGLFDRFRIKLAVYRYVVRPAAATAIANGDHWIPIDQCSIRSLFSQQKKLAKRFQYLLERGFSGGALVRGERWVSYAWISEPGRAAPVHLQQRIKPYDSYWIFEGHTREECRGLGCFTKALEYVVNKIKTSVPAPLIYVDARAENVASRRAILSAGFRPSGIITTHRLWVPRLGSLTIWSSWQCQKVHPNLCAPGDLAGTDQLRRSLLQG